MKRSADHDEEQITSTLKELLDTHHLSAIQKNSIINLIGGTLGISIIWYVFETIIKSEHIHIWALLAFLNMLIYIGICTLTDHHRHIFSERQWKYIFFFPALLAGLVWGSLIFFTPNNEIYMMFMSCIIIAVVGTALGTTGNNLSIFAPFTSLVTAFLVIRLVELGGFLYLSLALFISIYFLVMLSLAYKFTQASTQEHRLLLENKALVQQLANEKQVAEKANEEKSRFLASASHDLRQPIHALNLFIDALGHQLTNKKRNYSA
ncbi:MAG: hypothetical protein COW62_12215, partial [Zetaproteobacteria bacterium CG17_big_fil_post_rev_8_21_14_2_50_50_13]